MIKIVISAILLLSSVSVEAKTVTLVGTTGEQVRATAMRIARKDAIAAVPVEAKDIHIDANCVRESDTFSIGYTCAWQATFVVKDGAR